MRPRSQSKALPEERADGAPGAMAGWLLVAIRYVVPAVVVLTGTVIMALGGEANLEGGAGIISAGLAIYFLNWLVRAGAAGERVRDSEDAAREYFDVHGRWPD